MRRLFNTVLQGLLLLCASLLSAVSAQDKGGEGPVRDAEVWLQLIDANKYQDSHAAAGELFRRSLSAPQWQAALDKVRKPLGAVLTRGQLDLKRLKSLPGLPDGDYVVLQFRTDFAQRKGATETLTLMSEGGRWQAIGYFIQ